MLILRRLLARFSQLANDAQVSVREHDLRETCSRQADRIDELESELASTKRTLSQAQGELEIHKHEIDTLAAVNQRSLEWITNIRAAEGTSRKDASLGDAVQGMDR